jgi:hypothetical protein
MSQFLQQYVSAHGVLHSDNTSVPKSRTGHALSLGPFGKSATEGLDNALPINMNFGFDPGQLAGLRWLIILSRILSLPSRTSLSKALPKWYLLKDFRNVPNG